ncbi:MAG: single-stranded-DNA-specific exonuclease RecJ [Lysobacterales bacterium]
MIDPARVRLRQPTGTEDALPDGLPGILRRVLLNRGISAPEQLDLGLGRLEQPHRLSGLQTAAKILADAVQQDKDVLIAGDFDADGATGTALAMLALRAMGASRVRFRVPNRFEFGYGLTTGLVESMRDELPDVLVTVDSGIACNKGVELARRLGSTVIVTDHHLPGETLPPAHAIVNPNCPGDEFGSKALAGVGVMFYLLSALRSELRASGWFGRVRAEPNLAAYLDLVALGTVADLVPLDHNNRVLVRQGMERIRRGLARPGLLTLLRLGKRDYRFLVANDLAFAVAPRLNAAGRLEDMSIGIRCLISEDPEETRALADQLEEYNRNRKKLQEQMQAEATAQVQDLLKALKGSDLPTCLCLHDERWHQGIVGLVASRIKDAVHRPVVVFAPESEGSDLLKGSARSVKGLHMRDLLARVDATHPGLISAFGGHAMAAGLSMPASGLGLFSDALDACATQMLGNGRLTPEVLTDGELASSDINLRMAMALRDLGPWGQQFPEPLFEGAFEIVDQRIVGGAHLKMVLRPLDGSSLVDAIAFGTLPEDLPSPKAIRALYRLDVNHFRGERSCQLMIEHLVSHVEATPAA